MCRWQKALGPADSALMRPTEVALPAKPWSSQASVMPELQSGLKKLEYSTSAESEKPSSHADLCLT